MCVSYMCLIKVCEEAMVGDHVLFCIVLYDTIPSVGVFFWWEASERASIDCFCQSFG
jgi:hypothetical protein